MRVMQRRRRDRVRSSWPTTENNNGMGMELVRIGDEADEAEQPGDDADKREDGNVGDDHEQSFIEDIQPAADAAATKSSDGKVVGVESALLFGDDENKSAMLDSEVVSPKLSLNSVAAGCEKVFFLKVPFAFFGCMVTAVQPNCQWDPQETFTKPFFPEIHQSAKFPLRPIPGAPAESDTEAHAGFRSIC